MNAHDVRRLRPCVHCGELFFKDNMIETTTDGHGPGTHYMHGKCTSEVMGEAQFLRLPKSELEKLRLDDIGVDLMTKVVNRLYPKKGPNA